MNLLKFENVVEDFVVDGCGLFGPLPSPVGREPEEDIRGHQGAEDLTGKIKIKNNSNSKK